MTYRTWTQAAAVSFLPSRCWGDPNTCIREYKALALHCHELTHFVLLSAGGVQLQGFRIQILILHQVQKFRKVFRTCRNNLFFVKIKEKVHGFPGSQRVWVHNMKKQLKVPGWKSTHSTTVKSRHLLPRGFAGDINQAQFTWTGTTQDFMCFMTTEEKTFFSSCTKLQYKKQVTEVHHTLPDRKMIFCNSSLSLAISPQRLSKRKMLHCRNPP